jgi:hypothetical protein
MKHILTFIVSIALLICSCAKQEDLTALKESLAQVEARVTLLEQLCEQINTNITSLQTIVSALQENDYITSVVPVKEGEETIGYTISFLKNPSITIYNGQDGSDGTDGVTPVISVKKDTDGIYYWTLNGEWLLDSGGAKIKAIGVDGLTPKLKIENDMWYLSYDDGKTWKELGSAVSEPLFNSVVVEKGSVYFELSDGTKFRLPCYSPVSITFDIKDNETDVSAKEEIVVNYTLEGNVTDSTLVTASSDGNYAVRVTQTNTTTGKITITCPSKYVDGYINVMIYDGNGYASVQVINFYEREMNFPKGLEYNVATEGGEVKIPLTTNFNYKLQISSSAASWISISETKAETRTETVILTVSKNNNDAARRAVISVLPSNGSGNSYCDITINQSSAYFTIDKSSFSVPAEGGKYTSNITSSRGLKVIVPSEDSWVAQSVTSGADGKTFTINVEVAANNTEDRRSSTLSLYSSDGTVLLGKLEVVQLTQSAETLDDMIFTVQANFANNYTVYLPLAGNIDCYIDWGDGDVEHIQNVQDKSNITHTYEGLSKGTPFDVKISGTVAALSSSFIQAAYKSSITAVKQWGNTGLKSMSSAFDGFTSLKTLPKDETMAFAEVTNFDSAFSNCTGLKTIPEGLFDACGNVTSFRNTFNNCSALESLPENLFSKCVNVTTFKNVFGQCYELSTLPETLFASCSKVKDFSYAFGNCTGLLIIPEKLFSSCTEVTSFSYTFYYCYSLTTIPEKLFSNCTKVTSFYDSFRNCRSLTTIPEKLFYYCPDANIFGYTFGECGALKSIPAGLFDNNRRITDFHGTFYDCSNVTSESPYTVIDGVKYHLYERQNNPDEFVNPLSFNGCFVGCSNLSDYSSMPNAWKNW